MILYIGCCTDRDHPKGLHVAEFDCRTGSMRILDSIDVSNPIYLARNSRGDVLYCNEGGGLGSFRINADGKLSRIDAVDFGAKAACHLALLPGETQLAWAAYSSAEAGLVNVRDGKFLGVARHDRHVGRGPDPRQSMAHCHAAVPTPDGRHYTVVDLGIDSLITYSADDLSAPGRAFKTEPPGAGPRHLVFHPDGKHAFAVFELGSRIAMYEWSLKDGFKVLDSCSTMPAEWKGLNQDAAIRFSPDGRHVIASNRGYDSLTAFGYDFSSGRLSFKARSVLPGAWPRDFVFIPGTDWSLVTMERSGTVLAAKYDSESATFTPVTSLNGLHRPVAVVWK